MAASDPNAKIYINRAFAGIGKASLKVPSNKSVFVSATNAEEKTISRVIDTKLSGIGTVDTICGWLILVPFIGLAFPGAYELETNNVILNFPKEKKPEFTE